MNYTKGEWKVDQNCGNKGLYQIFSMVGESCYLIADILPRREVKANAHLIAAAPKLFKALDLALHDLAELGSIETKTEIIMMDAIKSAKAEGK